MKISLIMATLNRIGEVKRFIDYLDRQIYRDFELVIVDQNDDDRLVPVLKPYEEKFPILHLRSEKGLSRARNVGLKCISGDIVAFPDDDCWYPPDLLLNVKILMETNTLDGVSGSILTEDGKPIIRWKRRDCKVNKYNVWFTVLSASLFIKRNIVDIVGYFDENLGLPESAGEETDYVIRALEKGATIFYFPNIVVRHRKFITVYDQRSQNEVYKRARGIGTVLRKHQYPLWYLGYWQLRSLGRMVVSLAQFNFPRMLNSLMVFKGRLEGWKHGR